jgi:hypothetical protein
MDASRVRDRFGGVAGLMVIHLLCIVAASAIRTMRRQRELEN